MNKIMKQIRFFLYAAISALAVASCAKEAELVEPEAITSGEKTLLTLSLGSSETKTALVGGKTTWTAGDVVRIYNATGTFSQDVEVPASASGLASAELEVNMKDTVYYAVSPAAVAGGCSGGKVNVNIPGNPDGLFSSANICAAKSNGTNIQMRNLTAVLKVNINSGNVIEILQVNAKNAMVGTYEADLSGADPVLTAKSGTKSATVAVGGVDGDYYIAVAPGTYAEKFSVTALRGNGGFQTLTSSQANEIAINTIVPLGTIGNNLSKGLSGEGTEGNPYVISNLGEFGAFSSSVNLGNPYQGKFVKLDTDIEEAVTTPIGYYLASDEQFPFAGSFDGGNHSVKLDLVGKNCKSENYVALFGLVDEGAVVKDLKVTGTVSAEGNYTAGIVGYVRGSAEAKVLLSNCENAAQVTSSADRVAGVAGYATQADIENCKNSGKVSGRNSVGGIVGYMYQGTMSSCSNSSEVVSTATEPTAMFLAAGNVYATTALATDNSKPWTNGTGGIGGYAQNVTVKNPSNTGNVTAYMKLGGILGVAYWTSVFDAVNSGVIEGTGALNCRADSQMGQQWGSVTGGIVGWVHTYGVVKNATNNGAVKGHGGIGGIVGNMSCSNNDASRPTIDGCTNNADIASTDAYQGGTSAAANPGTGGIVGNLVPFGLKVNNVWRCFEPTVINSVNKGNVSSLKEGGQTNFVGGIAGSSYFGGAVTNRGATIIDNCVNEGDVTGGYWVAGILGGAGSRYCGNPTVKNCANHGKITSVAASSKYSGVLIGGLVGGTTAYNAGNRKNTQVIIYNSYNDGEVVYESEDYATPYVGGVIGSTWGGAIIQNVYNSAYVGPKSKAGVSESIAKCIGALAGYQYANIVHYSYFLQGIAGNAAVGANSGAEARTDTVCSFDEKGDLSADVTANDVKCTTLLQVLNEWQNYYVKYGYNNWTGNAAHPVLDTTSD